MSDKCLNLWIPPESPLPSASPNSEPEVPRCPLGVGESSGLSPHRCHSSSTVMWAALSICPQSGSDSVHVCPSCLVHTFKSQAASSVVGGTDMGQAQITYCMSNLTILPCGWTIPFFSSSHTGVSVLQCPEHPTRSDAADWAAGCPLLGSVCSSLP